MDTTTPPNMRIQVAITGTRAKRVRQIMAINGFKSENEAVQYLVSRGIEHASGAIRQWDMLREVQERTLASQADLFSSMESIMKED